ncbi:hypothetical protein KM043_010238 [Ampulex compressa]|nr:hypothetical protein KM043_010238 [Ampulex compressa]
MQFAHKLTYATEESPLGEICLKFQWTAKTLRRNENLPEVFVAAALSWQTHESKFKERFDEKATNSSVPSIRFRISDQRGGALAIVISHPSQDLISIGITEIHGERLASVRLCSSIFPKVPGPIEPCTSCPQDHQGTSSCPSFYLFFSGTFLFTMSCTLLSTGAWCFLVRLPMIHLAWEPTRIIPVLSGYIFAAGALTLPASCILYREHEATPKRRSLLPTRIRRVSSFVFVLKQLAAQTSRYSVAGLWKKSSSRKSYSKWDEGEKDGEETRNGKVGLAVCFGRESRKEKQEGEKRGHARGWRWKGERRKWRRGRKLQRDIPAGDRSAEEEKQG